MTHPHSGCLDAAPSAREQAHAAIARRAAAAGIVLLRNTGILPLDPAARVALLGAGAGHTVKGGIGSGDVNNRANVSIHAGLKAAGIALTSEDWLADYENRFRAAREAWKEKVLADAKQVENPFDAYSANPFVLPAGRPVTPRDTKGAVAALYVISRIAGEGKDRRLKKGDYYLSDAERSDLMALDRQGLPIVLLLNAGGPVELTGLLDEASHIEAILQISQLGQQGGEAVADVLLGKVTPEGKLTATWARHYEDYPDAGHFSYLDGDLEKAVYTEGIYVGYRWFDSFGVQPLFPFGYGLSYTSFSVTFEKLSVQPGAVQVSLTVQNNGICFAGRETAQVYLSCPQNGRARELRRLAGFAKTGLLAPGQSQTLAISIPQKQLASFDPQRQGWVVEHGSYGVWVGSSSAHLQLGALIIYIIMRQYSDLHIISPKPLIQLIDAGQFLFHRCCRVWLRHAETVFSQLFRKFAAAVYFLNRLCIFCGRIRRDEISVISCPHQFSVSSVDRSNHRFAAEHRLQYIQRKSFPVAAGYDEICRRRDLFQIGAVSQEPHCILHAQLSDLHSQFLLQRPVSRQQDLKSGNRFFQFSRRFDQCFLILVLVQFSCTQNYKI